MIDPATTYIDPDVEIGADTVIHPGVIIEGQTRIGAACEIQAHVRIVRFRVRRPRDDQQLLLHRWCARCRWRRRSGRLRICGPRPVVGEKAKVGNFVELKKTTLGPGSKANHLSYLGDATIGADVNVGAGTITCNYDGDDKHQTVIEDGAFIGSDTQLIAPVHGRQGRLRRRRFLDHRGRAGRGARHRARATDEYRRLGRARKRRQRSVDLGKHGAGN